MRINLREGELRLDTHTLTVHLSDDTGPVGNSVFVKITPDEQIHISVDDGMVVVRYTHLAGQVVAATKQMVVHRIIESETP